MLSELITSVADALISYAIDKLDPAERIKSWLKQDPARIAFQKALARAYSAFARQYPEYTSSLFDQSFLSKEALPELSKLLTRSQHPDPALLAQAWGKSIGKDTDFAQVATKPASYFLERFKAELKAEPALQALFDSRALESLPKLEAEIQKLASDLKRGLDEALKAANNYQQANIYVGGSVSGDGIVIGNNNNLTVNKYDYSTNYYYSGDFVSLNEYYIPPDGVFQRVRVDEFVGRDWLTAKVDAFLNDPSQKSGAFLLVGDAGVGKTAFMAHLVKERRYVHLFAEQVPGQAMLQRALQSLGSQLVTRYQIDPYKDRDTLTQTAAFPDFLERLLRLAASTLTEGEKIVIVCDALDEAGVFPDHFVFGLPKELPNGVYLILSQRPVNTKLPNFEPLRFDLEARGEDNLQDMEDYLSAVAKRPAVAGQIRAKDYSEDFFVQTLKEKSLGVWMYLHYVIKEIERGQRVPLDLESLPKGLVGYYADYWDNWRSGRKGSDAAKWDSLYAPLLATLAAAQEAITVEKLIEWAGAETNPNEVTRLLSESWGSFITEKEEKGKTVYALYHQSLRDFITGKVEDIKKLPPTYASLVSDLSKKKVEAHQRIVNAFEAECNGKWERLVAQDYPRLHLTAHLNGAQEYKKLTDLLTEGNEKNKWADAREKKEETYAGYLNDLTHVWVHAEQEQNYALAIRCLFIESSIHSLASNIPPNLLVEMAKAGLWSYARCLNVIRQKTEASSQSQALKLLAPDIPPSLHQETLLILLSITDGSYYFSEALSVIVPRLNDELKQQLLSFACKTKNEAWRSAVLSALAPHLSNILNQQSISSAREIKDKYLLATTLSSLVPYIGKDLNLQLLKEAFAAANEIKSEDYHYSALTYITLHICEDVAPYALSIIQGIEYDFFRADALPSLAPYLSDDMKLQVLDEIHNIRDDFASASALCDIAPYLNDKIKSQVIQEVLNILLQSQPDKFYRRIHLLPFLSPYMTTKRQKKTLKDAVSIALSSACKIEANHERTSALSNLIPFLSDTQKIKALKAISEVSNEYIQSSALCDLVPHINSDLKSQVFSLICEFKEEGARANGLFCFAPYLSDEFKEKALEAMHNINNGYLRANVLTAFALQFPNEIKTQALQQAVVAAYQIRDEYFRIQMLSDLAPYFSEALKAQVFSSIYNLADESAQSELISVLAPYLTEEQKKQALTILVEFIDESNRDGALLRLAPHLTSDLKTQALDVAYKIVDDQDRSIILESLEDDLADEANLLTLDMALKIQNNYSRATALISLLPNLDKESKLQAAQEALTAISKIEPENCVRPLSNLTPHLNDELKVEALTIARQIKDEATRSRALLSIMPYLNNESKLQVLPDVRKIKDMFHRANALSNSLPYLSDDVKDLAIQEALETLREIENENTRAYALSILVPNLKDAFKPTGLEIARNIQDESQRVKILLSFAKYLNDDLKTQVLHEALALASKNRDVGALSDLTQYFDKEIIIILEELLYSDSDTMQALSLRKILDTWRKFEYTGLEKHLLPVIKKLSQKNRKDVFWPIGNLSHPLAHFRGTEIAEKLYRAITDVTRWWP